MIDFLEEILTENYGKEKKEEIIKGLLEKRISSFRINRIKASKEKIRNILKENNILFSEINFLEDAFIIDTNLEKDIRNLSIYENGEIYFQSLSSMLPVIFLEPKKDEDILDMAAAPGGKTLQIASITNNETNITAVEFNKIRAEKLKYNIEKQEGKVNILEKDARYLDDFLKFDKILLDAPCTGSGTLNLNIENNNFKEELLKKCIYLQEKLLEKASKLLKKNGVIIYSTCSILKEENEEILKKILLKNSNIILEKIELKGIENLELLESLDGTITIKPNKYFEGFFISKLRKV